MHRFQIHLAEAAETSEINIGCGIRHQLGPLIQNIKGLKPQRIAVVSNKRVFALYGRDIMRSLKGEKFRVTEWLMPEGERFKSFSSLERAVAYLAAHSFERNDLIVALGGGVVGDLAGFSAAVYLRGIPLVQVPTTLLAQIDSSVGGKTAINLSSGKNLVGAFHQPAAVAIDVETLSSLPQREFVAGFCEMVKQGLVSGPRLLHQTVQFLNLAQTSKPLCATPELASLIAAHCEFKASVVAGDEKEATDRSDAKSRKILNFGHTTAHALEAVTNYRVFRHGEAVGYGLLVAGQISKNLGLLDAVDFETLREAVHSCGALPSTEHLDLQQVLRAIHHDKKSVRGEVSWVLLEGIGQPRIVPATEINKTVLRSSLRAVLKAP